MSERTPDRFWSGIDITKLVAGTLAAVSAAVIGSFLGVAGTLIGAAVASLVGGIGTELYEKSLKRGVSRIKARPGQPPVTAPAAVGTPAVAKPSTETETPGHFDPVPQTGATRARRPRWQLVAVPAMAFFALAMGTLFAVESFAGQSLPSMVGASSSRTTTVGSVVGAGKKAEPTTRPSTEPTEESDGEQPAGEPTGTQQPDSDATTSPAPDATTTAPTETGAPAPTGGPGAEQGDAGEQGGTEQEQQEDATDSGGSGGREGLTGEQDQGGQAPAGAPASQ